MEPTVAVRQLVGPKQQHGLDEGGFPLADRHLQPGALSPTNDLEKIRHLRGHPTPAMRRRRERSVKLAARRRRPALASTFGIVGITHILGILPPWSRFTSNVPPTARTTTTATAVSAHPIGRSAFQERASETRRAFCSAEGARPDRGYLETMRALPVFDRLAKA
jgi:hypothetical protein